MTDISDRTQALLDRLREDLLWLIEDGYEETKAIVVRSAFDLTFEGPHGRVTATVDLGRGEILIWLARHAVAGHGPSLLDYLAARGLPVPRPGLNGMPFEAKLGVVDQYASALELLRDKELAGDWAPLDDAEVVSERIKRQKRLVHEIVSRARADKEER